jgi:hypothetical protein
VGDAPVCGGCCDCADAFRFDRPSFDILLSRATSVANAAKIATETNRVRMRRCLAHFIQPALGKPDLIPCRHGM